MIKPFATLRGSQFSRTEIEALRALRAEYRATNHVFTDQELDRLAFLRWQLRQPRWDRTVDRLDDILCHEKFLWTTGAWIFGPFVCEAAAVG